jgi:hypothetical protein
VTSQILVPQYFENVEAAVRPSSTSQTARHHLLGIESEAELCSPFFEGFLGRILKLQAGIARKSTRFAISRAEVDFIGAGNGR